MLQMASSLSNTLSLRANGYLWQNAKRAQNAKRLFLSVLQGHFRTLDSKDTARTLDYRPTLHLHLHHYYSGCTGQGAQDIIDLLCFQSICNSAKLL